MEAIVVLLTLIAGLAAFDVAALRWGADSRELLPDDHHR
jgi:hypothetical protein